LAGIVVRLPAGRQAALLPLRWTHGYIFRTMKARTARVFVLCLVVAAGFAPQAPFAEGVGRVVGAEAGYGYLVSSEGLAPDSGSGLAGGLYYGYLIGDRPRSSTLLSLVLGYALFPEADGPQALHALVYGLEYAHTFFRAKPVALVLDYGLLFNLLLQEDRDGYAFGHHTRLGLGPLFRLGGPNELVLRVAYNFVTFPYYELASARLMYPSLALRYQRRL
jgi:hypothetical protein